jgi:hypothetical protein
LKASASPSSSGSRVGSRERAGSPVGNLTGGSVTYSNNLEKIETIGMTA